MPASSSGPAPALFDRFASTAAAVVIVVIFVAAYACASTMQWEANPRSCALARQSARAGLEYARAHLTHTTLWRETAQDSGIVQLYTAGPYRLAFVVRSRALDPARKRFEVEAYGFAADFLRPRTWAVDLRGAGGTATDRFPANCVVSTALARGTIEAHDPPPSAPPAWVGEPTVADVDTPTIIPPPPPAADPGS